MPTRDLSAEIGTPHPDANRAAPAPPPGEKSIATLAQLRVGVKLFVNHLASNEFRLAEILSITTRRGEPQYYVHYNEFNKRLDEWVTPDRLDLSREVEWPRPEKPATKKDATPGPGATKDGRAQKRPATSKANKAPKRSKKDGKRGKAAKAQVDEDVEMRDVDQQEEEDEEDSMILPARPDLDTPSAQGMSPPAQTPRGIGKADVLDEDEVDLEHPDIDQAPNGEFRQPENFSKETEIEKLRTSGSMTQSAHEISRVRNLSKIQMGKYSVEPWYFSPYPVEYTEEDVVYICEFCLSYFGSPRRFDRHRKKCTLHHPPGNEIYRDENVSFFEIDGRRQRVWCRNLCLLSKAFLDHKTLYYDVDPFLFYCMVTRDEFGCHLIGYFSKEKESAEGYNVACILTLPQYQRHGYGKLLIAFSYELSKREGKLGSPEKPLSDLGLLSYRAFWQELIVGILIEMKGETTIDELATQSAMTTQDVIHTLQHLGMLRYFKGQHVVVLTDAVVKEHERQKEVAKAKKHRKIDPAKLENWKAPQFTAATRTWNW